MDHYQAIKVLMPVDLGRVSDIDMSIEGGFFDIVMEKIMDLLRELIPSTTDMLLRRWESEYNLVPKNGATLEDRRRLLLSRYIYVGNMSQDHYIALAAALGYQIKITEGGEAHKMFRAAISRAGDAIYSTSCMWKWVITTLNKPPESDIINLFNDLNPPHMVLTFENA